MNKTFIVAKYEYMSAVKRPTFWFATLFVPVFVGVLSVVSGYSNQRGEELLTELSSDIKTIYIYDKSSLLDADLIAEPFESISDIESAKTKIKNNEADALIIYPEDVTKSQNIEIYTLDKGILSSTGFEETSKTLLKQSGYAKVDDDTLKVLITGTFKTSTIYFDETGNEYNKGFQQYIIPAISVIIFFMSVFISAQFLLQSVSEEKENRMIETILSMITSKTLIKGKIIGLSSLVLTQQFVWIVLSGLILYFTRSSIPFDFSTIDLTNLPLYMIPINIYFILAGFFLYAAIMVGVGAVGTSYKDSQSLSSVFILMAVMPIYFIVLILAEPNGLIAQITSYFPFTAPMVMLVRNSITELAPLELAFNTVLVAIYVVIAFWLAIKMFDLGALMYNRKPTIKELLYVLKKKD